MNDAPKTRSNNHKLIIGLLAGLLLGILITMYVLDYLLITTPVLITVLVTIFFLAIIILLLLTWFRERLLKKYLGFDMPIDTVAKEAQETVTLVSGRAVETFFPLMEQEKKRQLKTFTPRIINYLLWANLRNWGLRFTITIFAAIGGLLGAILLYNQNRLIDTQVNLEEANRRSSLIFLMSNIMDKVDEELKEDPNNDKVRNISPQLIGRIAALSQAMRPYRYLQDGQLIDKPLSPERGQLLTALVRSKFDSSGYADIYKAVRFERADLQRAQLKSAYLNETDLRDADLRGADLRDATLSGATLRDATLRDATLSTANFRRADLIRANLNGADLNGADLSKTALSDATLRDAYLRGANLRDAVLRDAVLRDAILSETYLSRADLSGADLSGTYLSKADLRGTYLSRADLSGADLSRTDLSKANLNGADLSRTALSAAMLIETDLSGADLSKANLNGADLSKTNFSNVKNITFEQLLIVISLYECKGLPNALVARLKAAKPELFEKPSWPEELD